jgi:hypothetical protein
MFAKKCKTHKDKSVLLYRIGFSIDDDKDIAVHQHHNNVLLEP